MAVHGIHVQKMDALALPKGRLFSLLTSKGHPSDTCANLNKGLVLIKSLQVLKKQTSQTFSIITHMSEVSSTAKLAGD